MPKKKFLFKFYILHHAIVVSSSFIVIFQKPNIFVEFVIELTLRLYLSPKASSCRKCDIFWVLAFCCWSKKRGWTFFLSIFYSNRRLGRLTAISRTSKKPYYYFHYNILFSLLSTIFFLREHLVLTDLWYITSYIEFFCECERESWKSHLTKKKPSENGKNSRH